LRFRCSRTHVRCAPVLKSRASRLTGANFKTVSQTRRAISAFQQSIGARADGKIIEQQISILYQKTDQGYTAPAQAYATQGNPGYVAPNSQQYSAPAQAYVEPGIPAVYQSASPGSDQAGASEAWEEPQTPIVQAGNPTGGATAYVDPANPQFAQAAQAGAQAWEEPATPGAVASGSPAPAQAPSNNLVGVMNTIEEAVCKNDSALFESVRSFIQANVVTKEQVIAQIRATYPKCVVTGFRNSLIMLTGFEGKDASYPIWLSGPGYMHGDPTKPVFDHVPIRSGDRSNVLITGNYAQLSILLNGYMSSDQQNADVVSIIERNVNKRDCLGFPPLYYAARSNNWSKIKWLIEKGANPNLIVPFTVRDVGFLQETIESSLPITVINKGSGKGYALKSQYSCVDNGPSAALMNSLKSNNELVPLWAIIAIVLSSDENNENNNYFLTRIMPMVPTVPKTIIPDLIDNGDWRITVNYQPHLDIIKAFVAKGADINLPTRENGTPMKIWIARQINPGSLQQLLAIGARM
jgi:hypothetical protein